MADVFIEARRGHWNHVIGVPGGCEPLYRHWELNSGPLEEQPVLITAETSLQPLLRVFSLYHSAS